MIVVGQIANAELATFGGGCFWCMEPPFEKLPGILSVFPGYMGGSVVDPSYDQVCQGNTGHIEVVQIAYQPSDLSYDRLLEVFWQNIDPTQKNQQFADRGSQYQTAIFYHNPQQKKLAEDSKGQLQKSNKFEQMIATEIWPAGVFYQAETYHCQYHLKNPGHYQQYKVGSGRAAFLYKHWRKKSNLDESGSK